MVTLAKALTRRHNPDRLEPFPECTLLATETAALVSVNNDMHNRHAVIKFQTRIGYKAGWAGADAVFINPRNTSALSCVCSRGLGRKNYAYPACAGRVIRVDGDANAVLNARRTTPSVARYGRAVRPSRDEAQRTFDVIPCPGVLTRGGRIFRVDDRKAIPEHSRYPPRLTGTTMPPRVNRTLITRPLQRYA